MKKAKFQPLEEGDKVGIIAPSGYFNRENFQRGLEVIRSWGLVPEVAPECFKKDFIFAGTVEERTRAFMRMAKRPDLKALWCVRGGYGAISVAENLWNLKAPLPPKILIGLSDINWFHWGCVQKWGWVGLHGPLVDRIGKPEVTVLERSTLKMTLMSPEFRLHVSSGLKKVGRVSGVARGPLVGGTLALLAASIGTPWQPQTDGHVLFFEDIGERAYRVDRWLDQLRIAGMLRKPKAIVIGDFTECLEPDGRDLVKKVFERHFKDAPYPVIKGLHSGHGKLRLTVPFGRRVEVKAGSHCSFEVTEGIF